LVTSGAVTGNGRALTSLNASNMDTGTLPSGRLSGTYTITVSGAATTAGTVTTAAQPNITSVGTLTALAVTGNTTSGNFVGTLNGSGANVTSINATNISSGTLAQARLANAAVTLGSTALTLGATVTTVAGLSSVTSTTFVGALTGAATTAGTVTTAAQPNITSVGTLTALAVTGNTTSGNFVGTLNGSGANVTAINATNISSGTLAVARGGTGTTTSTGSGSVVLQTAPTLTTPNLGTPASGTLTNCTSLPLGSGTTGTLTVLRGGTGVTTSTGTGSVVLGTSPTFTTQISVPAIVKTGTNGVGNIGAAGSTFNTIFAKATSAQYADLAELYTADADYAAGVVLTFGGTHEVTASTQSHDSAVAGVVSTDPSYLMNAGLDTVNSVAVALLGRVPCWVTGNIRRGDLLTTSDIAGTACKLDLDKYLPGCVIGKALQDYHDTQPGMIEIAVGIK
jgi:hypothetical protein